MMPSVGSAGNLYKKGFSDYTKKIPSVEANNITVFCYHVAASALLALHPVHGPSMTLSQLVMYSFGTN